jgi:histidine triad (HIT) family protein
MDNCIFCKIVKKEIPADVVFEDKDFIAFLDIHPVTLGHTLIIPKKHFTWMQDADDDTIAGIFQLAKKLMNASIKGLGVDYVHVSLEGKDVPHLHVHLIPRHLGDGFESWPTKTYKEGEAEEIIQKIISRL